MASINLAGDTSGSITLSAPAVAGTNTLSLPAQTATIATLTTPSFATTIGVGGATASASGSGISFPATASASTDANTLDDYEEGSWTPVLTDLTNNATMTSTVGRYIKIGRSVTLQAQVTTSSLGSVTGDIYFSGLPFSSDNTSGNYSAIVAGNGGGLAITSGQSVGIMTDIGSTILQLFLWDSAAGSTRMQASEWSSDGQIRFSITYFSAN